MKKEEKRSLRKLLVGGMVLLGLTGMLSGVVPAAETDSQVIVPGTQTGSQDTVPGTQTGSQVTVPGTQTGSQDTSLEGQTETEAPVASLSLNKKSITIVKGKTYTLKAAAVEIAGKLAWKSSKKSVAAVNSNGKITAQGKGTATITVKSGKIKATCKVKVVAPSLNKTYLSLKKGSSAVLKLTPSVSDVIWSSSNAAVAAVSNSGKVQAKSEGSAVIKAKIGVSTLKCKVTVTETKWQKLLDQYRDDPETNQLLFVKYTGGSSAEVVMYTKSGTKWKKLLSCSGEVGRNGINKVMEGDKKRLQVPSI